MNYETALAAALDGNLQPVYFFHGEEGFFSAEFIRAVRDQRFSAAEAELNFHEYASGGFTSGEVSSVQVVDLARTMTFSQTGRVIVAHIDELVSRPASKRSNGEKEEDRGSEWREREMAPLLDYASDPTPGVVLILVAEQVDRRLRTYKQLAASVTAVSCESLKGRELVAWLRRRAGREGCTLDREAAEVLAEVLESDLTLLVSELEKLITYAGTAHRIDTTMVREVAASSLQTDIFGLVDALSAGKADRACEYIRDFIASGAPVPYVLYMIGRQFRLTWQVKLLRDRGMGREQIRSYLNVHPYVVRKTLSQSDDFSYAALEEALELILEADLGLKTGRWDDRLGLELLAVRLAAKSRHAARTPKARNL